MNILMFGRGVITTLYAWALEKEGHHIEFYVKPGRISEYGDTVSLNVFDSRKKGGAALVTEHWKIRMREDFPTDHDYDLIIVSVQHYHFKSVIDFLAGKTGKAIILVLNSFWTEPKELTENLITPRLIYGFPGAGGGFDSNGVLNGTLLDRINIGCSGSPENDYETKVMGIFNDAGFKIKVFRDMRSYLLSHFAFNAAIHLENLKSADRVTLPDLFKTPGYWRNVILDAKELLPLLRARNVDQEVNIEFRLFRLPPVLISILMRILLQFSPTLKRMLTNHSNLTELKSYCKDVLITANELNIALPRFEESKNIFQ